MTETLRHFEEEAFDILARVTHGNTTRSSCGTYSIERKSGRIEISLTFAALLLRKHDATLSAVASHNTQKAQP